MGVCFPLIPTRFEAEAAVRAVRYPPVGERAWGPFYAPLRWGVSLREYQDRADEEVLAIATIEHMDALRTIGEVVATPVLTLRSSVPVTSPPAWGTAGVLTIQMYRPPQ
jgi:4-hydroxy-2-oxoheptanedioate aldolase